MTLKRLELSGFKSFAKRTVLDFSASVTAVVGPNGSGKSNVVEAIRFVLGEQSSKSLRSKSGADLIFKGSRLISKMSRASVTIVFDNSARMFQLPTLAGALSLDFDEISISREVYTDGTNEYAINGTPVRLRDVHELISSVNIGSSGHHIISQGEADRLLNAKTTERREMLEESLGLRLYHYRINEATKKLEKTREHMKETESLRRELAPHLKFLKKQVERVRETETMREELQSLYKVYLVEEESVVTHEMNRLNRELAALHTARTEKESALSQLGAVNTDDVVRLQSKLQEFHTHEKSLEQSASGLSRMIGRIEGAIEALSRTAASSLERAPVDRNALEGFIVHLEQDIALMDSSTDLSDVKSTLATIKEKLIAFKKSIADGKEITADTSGELANLETEKTSLEGKLHATQQEIAVIRGEIASVESDISKHEEGLRTADKVRFVHETEIREITHQIDLLNRDHAVMTSRFESLETEYRTAEELLGEAIMGLRGSGSYDPDLFDEKQHQVQKSSIDRLKVRLEDMGGGGAGDVLREYEETTERDQYLESQLADLEKSITDLETIISDLKQSLTMEFHKGIKLINTAFEQFFITMFGGGTAKLSVVDVIPRRRKTAEDDEEIEVDDDTPIEQGIDIDVNLPRKKVKDLEMLSGGERSLTSIALLFALSQVNPPPFLVLDETDAALDEANSKKYGDMIEMLARETQLIVVTHNRETMSRAGILYGVTLGSDDASTLLSIKFDDAVRVAK